MCLHEYELFLDAGQKQSRSRWRPAFVVLFLHSGTAGLALQIDYGRYFKSYFK